MESLMKPFVAILCLAYAVHGFENKTIGEFCEKRLETPVYIQAKGFAAEWVKKNESGDIEKEFNGIPEGQLFVWDEGAKPENKIKNRYGEKYLAYDHSRVILNKTNSDESDYINANWIDGVNRPTQYIATQGPVKQSASDFWQMVWENNAYIIVTLTRLMDEGKEKCYKYWPVDEERYGNLEVTHLKSDYTTDYVIRTFIIRYAGQAKLITQYHFTAWPDMGVPEHPGTLLQFIKAVRNNRDYRATKRVVVHCAGGMGRTGTFILADSMIQAAQKFKKVDVAAQLCSMRQKRINTVETLPQYIYVHQVLEAFTLENP